MGNGDDNGYPRILDKAGCIYGQHLEERMGTFEDHAKRVDKKLDRLIFAMVGAAISFGFWALGLWLN